MVLGVIVTAQYQHMMDNDGWYDVNISIQNSTLIDCISFFTLFSQVLFKRKIIIHMIILL